MSRVLPVLFNTDMVRAILDGRKTVTRRCVKYKYDNTEMKMRTDKYGTRLVEIQRAVEGETFGKNPDGSSWYKLLGYVEPKLPYQPGDTIYARETWRVGAWDVRRQMIAFDYKDGMCGELVHIQDRIMFERLVDQSREDARKAGYEYNGVDFVWEKGNSPCRWRPSIHMPREAARIWLKVLSVSMERLQEISGEELLKEGIEKSLLFDGAVKNAFDKFKDLWDSTIKKFDLDRYGWEANPWIWAIEFERCEKPESIT